MKIFMSFLTIFLLLSSAVMAEDRLYFPKPSVTRTVIAQSGLIQEASPLNRQNLADFMNVEISNRPYPPHMSVQVLGVKGEALLITAHQNDFINSTYRAEAAMARFSSLTRTMPVFVQSGIGPYVNFTDMLAMLGFKALILSDGVAFAYQVNIQQPEKAIKP